MGISYKGSQSQTERAVVGQKVEEEEDVNQYETTFNVNRQNQSLSESVLCGYTYEHVFMYHLETPYVMSVSHLCSLRSIT
jgi:hypothetical protein